MAQPLSSLDAFLFGAIQGITEYLPISSSAHLILLPQFLGIQDPGLVFDVFLHLGTLAATLLYFWRDWWAILQGLPRLKTALSERPREGETNLLWISLATVPALLAGALFHSWIKESARANWIQAAALTGGGVLLYLADRFGRQDRKLHDVGAKQALFVGCVQCLALIPGMSRSGSTMMGGRFLGLDRASAARFSFLISAPITAAALVFELRHWRELVGEASGVGVQGALIAGTSSFVFGILAIGGLLKLIRRFGYGAFMVYRVALAIIVVRFLGV